jgi:hypothetical protein
MRRLKVVANRSPALLKARFSTEVEVPFLNVADAEAELVIGTLKIEMLPPVSPNATLPAESTATAVTSLAVATTSRTILQVLSFVWRKGLLLHNR